MQQLRFILNGTVLKFAPAGWDDSLINVVRSDKYFSLSQKFTTQLSFVKDGAYILRDIFYNSGFEGVCILDIEQLNNATYQYVNIFSGNIDFSTFSDENEFVKVSCSDGSFWEIIKANENTEYEIDVDTNVNVINLDADFPFLQENFNIQTQMYGDVWTGLTILGFSELSSENNLNAIEFYSNQSATGVALPYLQPCFYARKNVQNVTLNTSLNANFKITQVVNYDRQIGLALVVNGTVVQELYNTTVLANNSINLDVNQSNYISLPTFLFNQFISFVTYIRLTNGTILSEGYKLTGSFTVLLEYESYPENKNIKCLTLKTVLTDLLTKINNGTAVTVDDSFLNTVSDYLITSGDALRSLSGSKIKTSLLNFTESINAIFCTGFGYEAGKALIALKNHFFQNTMIADVGEVSDFKVNIYKTHISNSLKVGYEEQTYDDVNGKYEPNQTIQFTFPLKKIIKGGELQSKYRADVYGILFTCLNLEGKTTTDSDSDNDIFIIHSKTTGGNTTFNRDFISVSGVPDTSKFFNVALTPKRNLLRNGSFINSFLHKISPAEKIKFQTATKSDIFQSRLNSEAAVVVEKADVNISDLDAPLFQPYILSFNAVVPRDFNAIVNANQNGYISFTYKGISYKGFINEIGVNPGKNSEYNFKLIAHTDCDLTKLIR